MFFLFWDFFLSFWITHPYLFVLVKNGKVFDIFKPNVLRLKSIYYRISFKIWVNQLHFILAPQIIFNFLAFLRAINRKQVILTPITYGTTEFRFNAVGQFFLWSKFIYEKCTGFINFMALIFFWLWLIVYYVITVIEGAAGLPKNCYEGFLDVCLI